LAIVAIARLLHLSAHHEGENWTTLMILGASERGAGCAIPGGINAELRDPGLIARSADPPGAAFPAFRKPGLGREHLRR
jgi:hypothetical protein